MCDFLPGTIAGGICDLASSAVVHHRNGTHRPGCGRGCGRGGRLSPASSFAWRLLLDTSIACSWRLGISLYSTRSVCANARHALACCLVRTAIHTWNLSSGRCTGLISLSPPRSTIQCCAPRPRALMPGRCCLVRVNARLLRCAHFIFSGETCAWLACPTGCSGLSGHPCTRQRTI